MMIEDLTGEVLKLENEHQESSWGIKGGRRVRL
jgi:hypothetical protein